MAVNFSSIRFMVALLLWVLFLIPNGRCLIPEEQQDGFVSLFNEKDLSGWNVMGKPEGFGIEDGVIVNFAKGGGYLRSDKKYVNYILRLEYKIGAKGNSGVYIHTPEYGRQSRVGGEIQIFDSYGKEPTPYSAGALYDIAAPKVNAAKPYTEWNDLEIRCEWPLLRVTLNGTEVIRLDATQDERLKWRLRTGYISLQDHTGPAWFRNLRIKDLGENEEFSWKPLFNGKNLDGLTILGDARWTTENGELVAQDGNGYAVTNGKFKNFHLWAYVKTGPKTNGGIFYRWNGPEDRGFEAQIFNDEKAKNMTGSIYNLAPAKQLYSKDGQWFPMQIIAQGARSLVIVNGKIVAEYNQTAEREGRIALQMHSAEGSLRFKDVRIQPLDAPSVSSASVSHELRRGDWTARFDSKGNLISFSDQKTDWVPKAFANRNTPRIRVADQEYACDAPTAVSQTDSTASFEYGVGNLSRILDVRYEITLTPLRENRVALVQHLVMKPKTAIRETVEAILPQALQPASADVRFFSPLKNGVGEETKMTDSAQERFYYFAGSPPDKNAALLAIPMTDEFTETSPWRLTWCSDPYFSTAFRFPAVSVAGTFRCVYEGKHLPFSETEERTFYTIVHQGNAETALDNFYRTALVDIPPGPEWLHEIAMAGYDYLSDGGQGWFRDIDWLTERLQPEERRHVCLALHGWYDLLGRYAFDDRSRRMDKEWTAFPNAPNVADRFPHSKSVAMTCDEVRRRLHYARDRGFRVALYFADGLAICEGAKAVFSKDKILYSGGWQGPDTIGPTHIQNPLHPQVYDWYLHYLDALLEEFGAHTDGFVWDETFHVDPNHFGAPTAPGYAARAMMQLNRDLTRRVHRFRADCVFMASDCIGANRWFQKAPYCLVTDGTYQDSHCEPEAWPYGLFPNYRNVLWSCNWDAVSHFDQTRIGVEKYQAPVAISNGWGDDQGVSEMPPGTSQKFLELFRQRMQTRTRLNWIKK